MNFYKVIIIIAIVFLILSMSMVGVALITSKDEDIIFPPTTSDCPDFYVKNENGDCENVKSIGSGSVECNIQNFNRDKYLNTGIGIGSGICEKKLWAEICKVNWDGITNNKDVCYKSLS